jgi:hypothetical protein
MAQNQFTEIYKTLSTIQLIAIIDNPADYQPLAVATAKAELDSRKLSLQEIESAKTELLVKQVKEQNANNQKRQKQQAVTNKALQVLDYANPISAKTPEKAIIIICVTLLVFYVLKIVNSLYYIKTIFRDFGLTNLLELTEIIWLPIAIFLFWRKQPSGRLMLNIWLTYNLLMSCVYAYYAYQFNNMDDIFSMIIAPLSLSTAIYGLVFYGGLLYYINTKKIKQLFTNEVNEGDAKMTIEKLYAKFVALNIPASHYYLQGLYGSTDDNDKPALVITRNENVIVYEVYYRERGEKHSVQTFATEDEACWYLFKKVNDNWISEQISKIEGLGGMAVNERLWESGLMNEFDNCKINDKTRAKQILRWLRVDEPSIDKIVN